MKSSANLQAINALAELERLNWKYAPKGGDEVAIICPCHDDTNPSLLLNTRKNVWKCQACKKSGDIVSLLAHILKIERNTMLAQLSERYELETIRSINPSIVEKAHEDIWASGPLLTSLRSRGVTDELIRQARLGYKDGRITIPVYDREGRIINIRKYLPGAAGPEKMRNVKGYGKAVLYQPKQTNFNTVWICGGEIKALVASSFLNPLGIGAVAVTGGEGAWNTEFTPEFKNKIVYICMDVDSTGRSASRKVASQVAYATQVTYIIDLPLDRSQYPKGDINDWVASGATSKDFQKVMEGAERFVVIDDDFIDSGEAVEVTLFNATNSEYMAKRINFEGIVSAQDENPFIVPHEIAVSCTRDQTNCAFCPVRPKIPDAKTGKTSLKIQPIAKSILEMVGATDKVQNRAIHKALKIPICKVVEFSVLSHTNVLDVRLTPQLQITGDNSDHVVRAAMVVGSPSIELNIPYAFSGRLHPHPQTQQATLLLDTVDYAEDNLSAFKPSEEDLAALKIFQPTDWTVEGLGTKLADLYHDFEGNVTRIFQRQDLHLVIDLAFHSCLYFIFDGRTQNGWVNAIVTGDSSQGKSETSLRLMEHYGLGTKHDCKNASTAGLLGGCEKLGSRWFVSWGVIPQNDRRIVFLEEAKGMSTEIIASLTEMRSSGVAQISKIQKRKAHSRTRIVMLSNPRGDRPVDSYSFGIEIIKELIGHLEDVRRFDLAVIVSSHQVETTVINRLIRDRTERPHRHTKELCRKCVLWAWTRSSNQIRFEDVAIQLCLDLAIQLCKKFSENIPLIDKGTMRYKLARLAIALAARTFSTTKDPTVLLVRECHVQFIANFIESQYSSEAFGYDAYTKALEFSERLVDENKVWASLEDTKFPNELVDQLLSCEYVIRDDFCDWCELDFDLAKKMVSFLVRKNAIRRHKRGYFKTPKFIALLKRMQKEDLVTKVSTEALL